MDFGATGPFEDAGGVAGRDAAAGKDPDPSAGTASQFAKQRAPFERALLLAGRQDAVAAQADDLLQRLKRPPAPVKSPMECDAYPTGRIREEMAVVCGMAWQRSD